VKCVETFLLHPIKLQDFAPEVVRQLFLEEKGLELEKEQAYIKYVLFVI
jgi:hypothetical protein